MNKILKYIFPFIFSFLILFSLVLHSFAFDVVDWSGDDSIPYECVVGRTVTLYDDYDNGGCNVIYTLGSTVTSSQRLWEASSTSDLEFSYTMTGSTEQGNILGGVTVGLHSVSEVPTVLDYPIYTANTCLYLKQRRVEDSDTDTDVIRRIVIDYDDYYVNSVFVNNVFDCPSVYAIMNIAQSDYTVNVSFDVVKYSTKVNNSYTQTVDVYDEIYSFTATHSTSVIESGVFFNINNRYDWRMNFDTFTDFDSFTNHPYGYKITNLSVEIVFDYDAFSSVQPNSNLIINDDYCSVMEKLDRNGNSVDPNIAYSNALYGAMEINDELARRYYNTSGDSPNPLLGVLSFVGETVSGFFDIDFFGFGWTFGTLFAVIAMILMAIIALKMFGGG